MTNFSYLNKQKVFMLKGLMSNTFWFCCLKTQSIENVCFVYLTCSRAKILMMENIKNKIQQQ